MKNALMVVAVYLVSVLNAIAQPYTVNGNVGFGGQTNPTVSIDDGNGTSTPVVQLNSCASCLSDFRFQISGSNRILMRVNGADSANLSFLAFSDVAQQWLMPLFMERNTANVGIGLASSTHPQARLDIADANQHAERIR